MGPNGIDIKTGRFGHNDQAAYLRSLTTAISPYAEEPGEFSQ